MQSPPLPRYLIPLSPNILRNTMFSNTLSFLSSNNVNDQVSHPYKTTGKITALCILTKFEKYWATYIRKGDSHLKHNSLTSTIPWLTRHTPYLLHIPTRCLHVGHCPPQPVSVLGPAPTLSPSFLLAQTIFEPNLFQYKYSIFSQF